MSRRARTRIRRPYRPGVYAFGSPFVDAMLNAALIGLGALAFVVTFCFAAGAFL